MTSQSEHEHNTLSCTEEQVAPLEAFSSVNKDALYAKISQKKRHAGKLSQLQYRTLCTEGQVIISSSPLGAMYCKKLEDNYCYRWYLALLPSCNCETVTLCSVNSFKIAKLLPEVYQF